MTVADQSIVPGSPAQLQAAKQGGHALLLAAVTMVWGSTFLLTQYALSEIGPFSLLALRFGSAALTLVMLFRRCRRGFTRMEVIGGLVNGGLLFAAYICQTLGLRVTLSSTAAFLSTLYLPLVPLLSLVVYGRRPPALELGGVLLAIAGLWLLAGGPQAAGGLGYGEWLLLGCAGCFALQVIALGHYGPQADPLRLTLVQLATCGLLAVPGMAFAGEALVVPGAGVVVVIALLGVVATALCYVLMNAAHPVVGNTQASLIYATEPVWAGLLGYAVGERLGSGGMWGCLGILAGVALGAVAGRKGAANNRRRKGYSGCAASDGGTGCKASSQLERTGTCRLRV